MDCPVHLYMMNSVQCTDCQAVSMFTLKLKVCCTELQWLNNCFINNVTRVQISFKNRPARIFFFFQIILKQIVGWFFFSFVCFY